MNIGQAKQEIINTVKAYTAKDEKGDYKISQVHQRPILLMGPPGIGKTAIMKQIASQLGIGLVEYTMTHHTRQSAVGLPILKKQVFEGKEYTVTEYTMSEIVGAVYSCRRDREVKEGILFLDEINCVSETLAPTMLQFLQQKTFGTHRLPEGWLIVAAGNPEKYNKSAREFDVVTMDRVKKIEVEEDYPVWRKYGVKNKIHPVILAYLDLRRENFYRIENTKEGTSFVTARGWEDLSKILKAYEELEIPVSEELVFQYLQEKKTAGEFSDFYELCKKLQKDYEPEKILTGNQEEYQEQQKLFEKADFEERLVVLSLLEAAFHRYAEIYGKEEVLDSLLHEELRRIKQSIQKAGEERNIEEILEEFLRNHRHAQNILKEKNLLEKEKEEQGEKLELWISKELLEIKKARITDPVSGFDKMKQDFYRKTVLLKKKAEETEQIFDRGIRFVAENPSAGQEAALFLTRISQDEEVMGFIREYGCRAYLENSGILLKSQREEELKKEIRQLYEM